LEFIQKLKDSLGNDSQFKELFSRVTKDPDALPDFKILDGLLFFKGKMFIPSASPFKQTLLEEFHSSLIGGHSGVNRTYGRLKESLFWFLLILSLGSLPFKITLSYW